VGDLLADFHLVSPASHERSEDPVTESDEEAWRRAQAGDASAFGLLFDRYADTVYRYAYVRLRRQELAEDVVSYVFAEAWRQRARIELTDGLLRPWLLAVARNRTNRIWREQAQMGARPNPAPDVVPDHADAVAGGLDAATTLGLVLDAIAALPDGPRETLTLHVWGDLSHEQIATEMGVSVGTVKSRLSRARSRLGPLLRPGRRRSNEAVPT
jgi:RNA polymerase sigma-70 factor (ECF subfamily)